MGPAPDDPTQIDCIHIRLPPRCPRPTVALAHSYSQGFSQENALSLRIVMMVELIRAGLATAKAERVVAWSRTFEVARVRITTPMTATATTEGFPRTAFLGFTC
jgi:hypothetical protein